MSTSSSLRQQFGAFCTNVPLGVWTLLEAPGLTTTLTAPKTALCVCPPLEKGFRPLVQRWGCLEKAPKPATCVCPPLDKGFPSTTPIRQGRVALSPYHTQRSCGREWEAGPDQPCVPATTFEHAVQSFGLIHGGSTRYFPHKQVSRRSFQPFVQCSQQSE